MLAISTLWNALKQPDGAALFDELKDLGFKVIALSRHLTLEQVEQLKPMLQDIGQIPPCSIQNFCPILPGTPQSEAENDKILLSSLDNDERKEAIRRTVQTMELAVEMEVTTVLLRLGEVDTYDRSYLMTDLYEYGEREFEAFSQKVTEATEWRKRKEAKHRDAVLRSLDELNERALRMELYIAIENRPYYYQIPNFDEVGLLFNEFYGSPMRYWHNVGHAALQEKLGLCWSHQWVEVYSEHLIGVTLHDMQKLEPHHPPGTGDLEWDELFTQFPSDIMKVMEIQHSEAEAVIQARELCESLMETQSEK
jgi:sugar phosphate isomerase/epimerase